MTQTNMPAESSDVARFVCIHGHFYQPPRENPWLESVELQESAQPYHDWNERILAECYAPNADCRLLDRDGRIRGIVNNYASISFNFGPTLLSWLEGHAPETYGAILEADAASLERFGGHGSALAQAYNHAILPLCNARDRKTQVLWGIRDFRHRFGREPEGMWLPETAVDLQTLQVLADNGIRFTVLAPSQARRVRGLDAARWRSTASESIDPRVPYRVHLPSTGEIDVFFYDGPISRAIAFEGLLSGGEHLVRRLYERFDSDRSGPQLVHVATDGETYGHHHEFGEMALAYALDSIESDAQARLTNYGQFLALRPPTEEVEIVDGSSWSCSHGLGRWSEDCGCSGDSHGDWNQAWRAPLRQALDELRDRLATLFESRAATLLRDPWSARDDYVEVILDRSPASWERFLTRHAFDSALPTDCLKLLELQRQSMLMYTSCGWFFDELSGIETVQILRYAGRAIQLAEELDDEALEERFLELLERAPSNRPEIADGRQLFERRVRPSRVDLSKVGADFAASLLFGDADNGVAVPAYDVDCEDRRLFESGRARGVAGRLTASSRVTLESTRLTFALVYLGDHNLTGGVRAFQGEPAYRRMVDEVAAALDGAGVTELPRILERHFADETFTLETLFLDRQKQILEQVLSATITEIEESYGRMFEEHAGLMRLHASLGLAPPPGLSMAGKLVLGARVRRELCREQPDPERLTEMTREAAASGVDLDHGQVAFAVSRALERVADRIEGRDDEQPLLELACRLAAWVRNLGFHVDLRRAENQIYRQSRENLAAKRRSARRGDTRSRDWAETLVSLMEILKISDPEAVTDSR
jgi:alpha-amylase/alpha-mannosidase (GH57 family)